MVVVTAAAAPMQEWDIDAYGPRPMEKLLRNREGFLDSLNFTSATGYKRYRHRMTLASHQYGLHGTSEPEFIPGSSGEVLAEKHKIGYRVAAEVLLEAFRQQFPDASRWRGVVRLDARLPQQVRETSNVAAIAPACIDACTDATPPTPIAAPLPLSGHRQ